MASDDNLTPFSYVILALVGRNGAGPHDIVRMMREGAVFWTTSESHIYAEPKRLAKLGYLEAHKEPGRTRERTVYSLTDKGLEALRAYARTPATFTPLKSDPLLRMLICDLVGEPVTRKSIAALRDDIADIRWRLDDAERTAKELPHREKYLLLVIEFLRRLLDLHLDLVDEVEGELGAGKPRRSAP
jgi:DNA-binding PadR family transcriptional regulator